MRVAGREGQGAPARQAAQAQPNAGGSPRQALPRRRAHDQRARGALRRHALDRVPRGPSRRRRGVAAPAPASARRTAFRAYSGGRAASSATSRSRAACRSGSPSSSRRLADAFDRFLRPNHLAPGDTDPSTGPRRAHRRTSSTAVRRPADGKPASCGLHVRGSAARRGLPRSSESLGRLRTQTPGVERSSCRSVPPRRRR
jgi:hypothetical protein